MSDLSSGAGFSLRHARPQLEDKGKLTVTIFLPEAGIFKSVPVKGLLSDFSNFVFYTVELLENL